MQAHVMQDWNDPVGNVQVFYLKHESPDQSA